MSAAEPRWGSEMVVEDQPVRRVVQEERRRPREATHRLR